MRRGLLVVGVLTSGLAAALTAVACSLNPQPLPPDQVDGSASTAPVTGDSASVATEGGAEFDAGSAEDEGSGDATSPPPTSTEAGSDSSEEGHGEVGLDATGDAPSEGGDTGSADAADARDAISEAGEAAVD
jgi:hypothetical protein